MTTITASAVNKLRQMTGAGMMDCKKALQESNGDMDGAVDILRKKELLKRPKERTEKLQKDFLLLNLLTITPTVLL